MNKIIFANGCSHMAGDFFIGGASDINVHGWTVGINPATKLGKLLNVDNVINYAKGGSSNDRIYRTTIQFIEENIDNIKDYFFLIGWTSPDRKEVSWMESSELYSFRWKNSSTQLEKIFDGMANKDGLIVQTTSRDYDLSDGADDNIKQYFKTLWANHSLLLGETNNLNYAIGLQNILKNLGVNYYFYNAIGKIPRSKLIDTAHYFYPFDLDKSEYNYLKQKEFATPHSNHFDHDGVQYWAEIILNEIKNI